MVWTDYSWYMYLDAIYVVSALIWLTILSIIIFARRNAMTNLQDRKWFVYTFYYKIFFSLIFGLVYIFIIGGGDTLAYWEATRVMHTMFFNSPDLYFEQIFTTPSWPNYYAYFNNYVGYPPSFIYREPESYFVSKVTTLLSFATFKSYFAANFIYAFFASMASWKLYVLVREKLQFKDIYLKIGILFMPSVAFWCSGVSKDSLVFISSIYLIIALYKLYDKQVTSYFKNILGIIFFSFLIFNTRDFILFVILGSFFMVYIAMLLKTKRGDFIYNFFKRGALIAIGLGFVFMLSSQLADQNLTESNSFIQEAATVQEDFSRNNTYGNNRYSLGNVEFTGIGLLKVMPLATFIGIYEPLPWNARSFLLLINGLESILMVYLSFLFMKKGFLKRFGFIRTNEILLYCLIFSILIGFMAGFSSIIYGVLVRIKAPLLPFFMIILAVDWDTITKRLVQLKKLKSS